MRASTGNAELPLFSDRSLRQAVFDRTGRNAETLLAELRTLASASRTDKQALLAVLLALGKHPALTPLEREAFLRRALPITSELGLPAGILAAIGREIAFEHWAQGDRRTPIPAEEYRAVSSLPEIGRFAGATAYLRLFEARAHFLQGNYDAAAAIS